MTDYRVSLDVYSGPLDLLLFLIRREEVDIYDIPIAKVTKQYVEYIDMLELVDPEVVSEFLVLAATLMEIKSRMLLPTPPMEEGDEEMVDPRSELIRQLLEYKKFKDAAHRLEDDAEQRAMRYTRKPVAPPSPTDELELDNLQIWDLFEAFRRLLEQTGQAERVHRVGVDDTPIALHAADVVDALSRAGDKLEFETLFAGRGRPEMIGLFLSLLELIRQHRISVRQDVAFGPIYVVLLDATPLDQAAIPDIESAADSEDSSDSGDALDSPQTIDDDSEAQADDASDEMDLSTEPIQEEVSDETE